MGVAAGSAKFCTGERGGEVSLLNTNDGATLQLRKGVPILL
jgi:hypothetical protein